MKHRPTAIMLFVANLALAACTELPTDPGVQAASEPAAVNPANPSEEELNADFGLVNTNSQGGRVYAEACAACHEQGLNRAPQRAMLVLMSPESIYRAMTSGIMQTQASALSDDDKIAVSEFLAKRKINLAQANAEPVRCEGDAARFDYAEPPVFSGWGLDPASTHSVATKTAGLNKRNIQSLRLKWAFAYPGALRARSQPALAGGAVYVGSHGGTVYAFDRETGCTRWTFDASSEVRTGIVVSPWDAGDTSAKPLLYFLDLIGNVYALDAAAGTLQWRARPDEHPNTTLTATPALHNGVLYVPVSSLEVVPAAEADYECCNFRGSVVAYEANTGEQMWQAFTIPEEPKPQQVNAKGTQNYGPSGAPIWNTPAIDVARNQLTIGTGENYSSPASGESDAIIAFDLDSGKTNWIFQATAGDAWNVACGLTKGANCPQEDGPDFDFGAGTILATDSAGRDYIIAGQKSGVVHAIDPNTGKRIWQRKVGRGGVHAGVYFGMAVQGDRVFVPISDTPDGREYDEPARPGLYALDLKTGEYLWQAPSENICRAEQKFCNPGYAGAITATPELVIAGSIDGHLRMFDAATGKILWDYDTAIEFDAIGGGKAMGGSFGGGSAPVAHNGQLIVNSGYGFALKMPGNALLVFEVADGSE
ncbi:MAG: PQQ-binding-like beta-propeller repeat protein [Pseudomonadales bacterium]